MYACVARKLIRRCPYVDAQEDASFHSHNASLAGLSNFANRFSSFPLELAVGFVYCPKKIRTISSVTSMTHKDI